VANTVTIKVDANTKDAENSVKGMGEKFQSAMKGVAMAAGGLTIAAGAAAALGQEFQEATNLIARGTGATGEALEGLTESFRDVWKDVPQDAATVAGALADINTEMGLEGEALETTTKAFLDFSRAMGEDVGTAITTVADAMEIFNVPVEETQSLLDKLTVASQASGVSVTGLAANLETFGPILKNAGFTIEESTAIFANLEAAGIGVTRVMPAMNQAIRKLAEEGVTDIKGALLGQIEAIKTATTTTEALNIATDLFGAEGAQRFVVGIRNGALELDTLTEAMENSDGTLAELATTTLTMSDRMNVMKNRAKDALVPFGNFATAIGPMVIMIPAIATGMSALAASTTIATAATWLQTTAMAALNIAMGPVGLIILGIVAAIAGAILIFKNWDTITAKLSETWGIVKEQAGIIWHGIGEAIESAINFIIGVLNVLIQNTNSAISLWLTPLQGVLKVFGNFIPKANELADALKDVIPEIGTVNVDFKTFGETAGPNATQAIKDTKEAFKDTGELLKETVTPAIDATTAAFVGTDGVTQAMGTTSGKINDDLVPSLQELTDALAKDIEKSVKATEQADLLQHALFILETQQDGVRDAYNEGLLTGADVIKMYENMSVELTDDVIPAVEKLETKFRAVGVAANDMSEIMSGSAAKNVATFFNTLTGVEQAMGSGIPQINKQVDQQLKGSGYFDLPTTPFVPPVAMTTSPRFTGVASQFGEGDEAAPLPDVFKGLQTRLTGGGVVSRDQLSRLIKPQGGGGGGSMVGGGIEININGPTYGMDDFEDKVAEAIRDGARRGGFEDIIRTA
jgi:hypothetical protein